MTSCIELCRYVSVKKRERAEAKHHNKPRKRKQNVIPLVTASERGRGQTESAGENPVEMWSVDSCQA